MTLFEALFIGHLIGDWLLQTEWQAENKERNWLALASHVLVYHAVIFLILLAGFQLEMLKLIVVVIGLALVHAILDRRKSVQWFMRTMRIAVKRNSPPWLTIAVDQSLHLVLLAIAALILSN